MPELLRKSKANISAANLLIEHGIYAPSVHCSYYACLQKLKNLIASAYDLSYRDLETERKTINKSRIEKIGSHEFLIDLKLMALIKREEADHRIVNKINELKLFRRKSDYDPIVILKDQSEKMLDLSTEIIESLDNLI